MTERENTNTIGHDLRITKVERGLSGIGNIICGTVKPADAVLLKTTDNASRTS